MITIKNCLETCITIKKSRFLGAAFRIGTQADAQRIIEHRKKQHQDARHSCYAWRLENNTMRYSDDGEPQGTAGVPILEVIKNFGLVDVLVIVTRYFGGILLGAPGLVRAYTQCTTQTLNAAQKVRLITCNIYDCVFDFASFSRLQTPLISAGCKIDNIVYGSDVRAKVYIAQENCDTVLKLIRNLTSGKTNPVLSGSEQILADI